MARTRAADYDNKRRSILDRSARAFACEGYNKTSMAQIAKICGFSKGLLYHYYENKEALLTDILRTHLDELLTCVRKAVETKHPPVEQLRVLCTALLNAYEHADAEHKLQLNELGFLPPEKQMDLKALERQLVEIFANAIVEANPALKTTPKLVKPLTMSLFGMLNWSHLWFRPDGDMDRAGYANVVTTLIVNGSAPLVSSPSM